MTQISDDIGNGFEEDMLDMQGTIGSYRSLQRRMTLQSTKQSLAPVRGKYLAEENIDLFGDLLPPSDQ